MRSLQWIVLSFCFLIAACSSVGGKNWKGSSTRAVFKKMGYPNHVARLSQGRFLFIYRRKHSPCTAIFKVSSKQKVISVQYQGGQQCRRLF